jgi:hypothetical protein
MKGEHHAVTAGVDVGLHVAIAELDRAGEGRQRVLGGLFGASPMGKRGRRRGVEKGMDLRSP